MRMRRFFITGVALSLLLVSGLAAWGQASSSSDETLVKDFETRVKQYMDLRTKEAGTSPKPTNSAAKLADTREQMAEKLRQARAGAKQGDIFTPAIAGYFRRQIAATMAGPQGSKIRASLRHAEPLKALSLKINEKYPEGVPLQSTPPSLLLNLPALPKELQYRLVDDSLLLYDSATNVIVDLVPHVLPQK